MRSAVFRLSRRVRIGAYGGFSAEFLDLCGERGIPLYDVRAALGEARFTVFAANAVEALKAARDAGMETRVLWRRGLGYRLTRYAGRWGIPVGILLASVLLAVLSSFIWRIEIVTPEGIDPARIRSAVEAEGVKVGTFVCRADTGALARTAAGCDDHIRTAVADLVGTTLFIRVTAGALPPEKDALRPGENLCAGKDGVIILPDISAGTPMVKAGDQVRRGDILVIGSKTLKNGETRLVAPRGRIMAQTALHISCAMPQRADLCPVRRLSTGYALCFFGCEIPLYYMGKSGSDDAAADGYCRLKSGTAVLPIGVRTRTVLRAGERGVALSAQRSFLLAAADLAAGSAAKLKNGRIAERAERISERPYPALEAGYICEEDIAVTDTGSVSGG